MLTFDVHVCILKKKKMENIEESKHDVIMAKDLRLICMGFYSSGQCLDFFIKNFELLSV